MELVILLKNYSSWSLRGWLALRQCRIPFREIKLAAGAVSGAHAELRRLSPSGKAPVLRTEQGLIWESLAIGEYLAERFPEAGLWPADPWARARARVVSSEMHAGFVELRQHCPMDIRNRYPAEPLPTRVGADVARIGELWRECLSASGGPFLFGSWTLADCMYAPVVTRLRTYSIELDPSCEAYCQVVLAHPPMVEWCADAARETEVIEPALHGPKNHV